MQIHQRLHWFPVSRKQFFGNLARRSNWLYRGGFLEVRRFRYPHCERPDATSSESEVVTDHTPDVIASFENMFNEPFIRGFCRLIKDRRGVSSLSWDMKCPPRKHKKLTEMRDNGVWYARFICCPRDESCTDKWLEVAIRKIMHNNIRAMEAYIDSVAYWNYVQQCAKLFRHPPHSAYQNDCIQFGDCYLRQHWKFRAICETAFSKTTVFRHNTVGELYVAFYVATKVGRKSDISRGFRIAVAPTPKQEIPSPSDQSVLP